jgi:hypothetical protein
MEHNRSWQADACSAGQEIHHLSSACLQQPADAVHTLTVVSFRSVLILSHYLLLSPDVVTQVHSFMNFSFVLCLYSIYIVLGLIILRICGQSSLQIMKLLMKFLPPSQIHISSWHLELKQSQSLFIT